MSLRPIVAALAVVLVSSSARAEGAALAGAPADADGQAVASPLADRRPANDVADDEPPPPPRRRLRRVFVRDARSGLLFGFGFGGGSLFASGIGRGPAFDFEMRLGYGFSDRFQLFMQVEGSGATLADGSSLSSWTATLRGQTVLIGDRAGNGLNLNAGVGFGGLTRAYDGWGGGTVDSRAGLAVGGGLSFDARLTRSFTLTPELYATWHQVPNDFGRAADIATTVGFRLGFQWYGP